MRHAISNLSQPPGFSPWIVRQSERADSHRAPRAEARRLLKIARAALFLPLLFTGCVQRQMTVVSEPSGALVYMNDREIGRTPFTRNFQWYGTYDVVLRKDGYQTQKTSADVFPPFWQFPPLDAVTDFLPLKDAHTIKLTLRPEQPVDPVALMQRGLNMQSDLQSSEHTVHRAVLEVHPTPASTTQPATQPTERGTD
jgi:hypothetical protein